MNLAVFLPNWIGDVVMATPALRALKQHFPQAHIVGICKPYVAGVLDGSPWLDEIIHLDGGGTWSTCWLAAAWRLRRHRCDLAVLFPNSFRSALVAKAGRCRRIIGFRRYGRDPLLDDPLEPVRGSNGKLVPSPIIDDYNRLAQAAGCPLPGHRMELFTTPGDESAADQVWANAAITGSREVVCLNPGAAFGAAKHWPIDYFARLAQAVADQRGADVLVLCGPTERSMADEIALRAKRSTVHSLGKERLSLGLTKALIRRASLLVTTDSGPRHFAAAFDRPVVSLFGPTHIGWTETYHPRAVNMQKPVPCGPCQLRACPVDHRCMLELTPSEVFGAVNELMAAQVPSPLHRRAS